MRGFLILGALLTWVATPVQAGHGTIRETETQIIIEYYGDASDKYDVQPAATPAQVAQPPAAPLPAVAAVQPAAQAEADKPVAQPQQADPSRPAVSQRAAQREQALELRRKAQAERMARRLRQPGDADNDE